MAAAAPPPEPPVDELSPAAPALGSPWLADGGWYERVTHGWVDAPEGPGFRMTVRLSDPRLGVELVADTLPSPEYRIVGARGRVLVDPAGAVDRALEAAAGELGGLCMTGGFTRRVVEVLGARAGAGFFVDAAVEIARLARQVTRLPTALVARRLAEGPVGVWRLDNAGWVDIPGSCYAFRAETEALFAARTVATPATAALYDPPPDARGVFNRSKVARVERRATEWWLTHAMYDEVHSFRVWLAVDATSARIVDAGSWTARLPYGGICSDPQARARALVGERVDAGFRRRLGALVGGPDGCAQLYDLAADLLKLVGPA
jgi:hypothetical protein